MLEMVIAVELFLHNRIEAAVITVLLVFNAALGFFRENRSKATLKALRSRLALVASVHRDDKWIQVAAADLVPGDLVKLSLGGIVPADATIVSGSVLLDQSMLTGESIPVEAGERAVAYAGGLIRRGEASAVVTATGERTKFGRTAELVRTAKVESTSKRSSFASCATWRSTTSPLCLPRRLRVGPWRRRGAAGPMVLTAILMSIPVALPATFTLAAAVGAESLAKDGVLPTRLSAVDEASTMDVLCADKTGTLTQNSLTVSEVYPCEGFDKASYSRWPPWRVRTEGRIRSIKQFERARRETTRRLATSSWPSAPSTRRLRCRPPTRPIRWANPSRSSREPWRSWPRWRCQTPPHG